MILKYFRNMVFIPDATETHMGREHSVLDDHIAWKVIMFEISF